MSTWYCDNTGLPYHLGWKDIKFEEPYPITLWRCNDTELPYKITWKDIKMQPPYSSLVWICDDKSLPRKWTWKDIEGYTTLNFPTVKYQSQLITKIDYQVRTNTTNATIISRVFEDKNKVYAYTGLNKQLTVVSTENTTIIWFDKLISFNNSTVRIDLGQFTHDVQNQIQLFLSDGIPDEWDLEYYYTQGLGEANSDVIFTVAENITKRIGIGFAHATVGIKAIYVDDVKVV